MSRKQTDASDEPIEPIAIDGPEGDGDNLPPVEAATLPLPTPGGRSKTYHARPGSHLTDRQAQMVGERLEGIEAAHGLVTPALIVADATPETSPLHRFFTWDDAQAARHYRMNQARVLVRNVVRLYVDGSGERKTVRSFLHVSDSIHGPAYVSLERITAKPQFSHQVAINAMRELNAWHQRYEAYSELASVLEGVQAAQRGFRGLIPERATGATEREKAA